MSTKKHISDELLASFIDENTTSEQNAELIELLKESKSLFEEYHVSSMAASLADTDNCSQEVVKNDFSLPLIGGIASGGALGKLFLNSNNMISANYDKNTDDNDRFQMKDASNIENDKSIDDMGKNEKLVFNRTYGEEGLGKDGQFDFNIYQGVDNSCAIRSQEIILRDYGIVVPKDQLIAFAEANGWYNDGTLVPHVGNILDAYGVETQRSFGNTVYDIVNELDRGHRIIVGVDSGELWAKTFGEKTIEYFEDLIGGNNGADHALIVAGFNVNPQNPKDVKVVLTDSGSGQLRVEYPLEKFQDAWKDSNYFMVSTTEPAPYQYNADLERMEPSNFATQYVVDNFISNNSFALPEDALVNYEPYYGENGEPFISNKAVDTNIFADDSILDESKDSFGNNSEYNHYNHSPDQENDNDWDDGDVDNDDDIIHDGVDFLI